MYEVRRILIDTSDTTNFSLTQACHLSKGKPIEWALLHPSQFILTFSI